MMVYFKIDQRQENGEAQDMVLVNRSEDRSREGFDQDSQRFWNRKDVKYAHLGLT